MCLKQKKKEVRIDQQVGNIEKGGKLINDVIYKNSNNNQRNALSDRVRCCGVFFQKWLISAEARIL
jgi:hypothetical protein